jgi:DNA-binding response OmpR family regulator
MADVARPSWIALASGGPIAELNGTLGSSSLRVLSDRAEFVSLLTTSRPHVAILASPPATAEEEALALRERRRRPTLRIVHLTAGSDVAHRLEALRSGFDEALPDTVGPEELFDRLRILEERACARTRALDVARDVLLDPVAHEVRRGGELIHLRPKEFQLLAMLAAHPGRAYTRRQLLDRVWGPRHVGDPRTVDVHVRWLRSKIEPTPDAPVHLVTVRGVGYRLDPAGR